MNSAQCETPLNIFKSMKKILLQSYYQIISRFMTLLLILFLLNSGVSNAEVLINNNANAKGNPATFLEVNQNQIQQELRITGKVSSDDGLPLPGANIVLSGTYKGVISKTDGSYEITVPSSASVLEFSYVGYVKQQVVVGNRTIIDVILLPDAKTISEVVVVGYAVEQKVLLTGAVGVVKSESLKDLPVSTLDGILQGQASGVQVSQNSGTPGGEMSVRIRGISSIGGSGQPLYIIDGIPVTTGDFGQVGYEGQGINALSDLNPADIESISILKDAAAASIYGARAGNGVVIITTKRGSNQRTLINFSAYKGVQQVWKRLEMLNSKQWMQYRNDLEGPGTFTQEQMDHITIDTDWQNVIFRRAPIANYELSATGGNEKTKFFMSGNLFEQQGTVIGSDYSRMNGRVNIDHNISEKLTIGASVGLTYAKTDRIEGDQSLHGPLPNGISTPAIYPVYDTTGIYYQGDMPYSNALSIANGATNQNFSFRSIGNTYFNYQILPGLSFSSKWGMDFLNFREHAFEYNTVQGKKYNGLGFETYSNALNIVSNNILKYQKSIGDNDFEFLGGYSFEKKQVRSIFIRAQDYVNENLEYINTGSGNTIVNANTYGNNDGIRSWFGRANYNYSNKYIGSFSGRFDSSSKFGENNRTGFFPSASVAWRIGEETFMDKFAKISELKIRTSYGLTGNDDIPAFRYLEQWGVTSYAGQPGIYPLSIPNPDLKWETTAQLDIGVDMGIFENRIFITADYYNKQTKGLLQDRPLPPSSGFGSITENIGEVENKGVELNITTDNLKGSFKWNTILNFSANRNKVLKLYNGQPIDDIGRGSNSVRVGEPVGIFYSYKWLGIDPSTGDCVYSNERMKVGNPHPDFIGGITNVFKYQGFDLNVFLQFSYGNDVFNGSRLFLESLQGGDNQLAAITRRWQKPGDITDIPRATSDPVKKVENKRVSSRFIEDGSYLRVKNLTLGYTFPRNVTNNMHLESLRVYFTAQNLFTFTNYTGLDPEVNYSGNDNTLMGTDFFTYPQSRSYNLGVNLKF
jgi:TonB-linked SusC/RagA family outer membrane protein